MITIDSTQSDGVKISVIGVGGGGCNTVDYMIENNLSGVEIIAANTDRQSLSKNLTPVKLQIGKQTTKGRGCGSNPEIGRKSAEENIEEIQEALSGSSMIFITSGMGGGTGTGAAPVIAKICQDLGTLVVAIVTKPFIQEGPIKMENAERGIDDLRQYVDAYIVIPNQKLVDISEKGMTLKSAFSKINNVLYNATCGIADIIIKEGYMNVDFSDVINVMQGMGKALMGIGRSNGENRAIVATQDALNSPLLDGVSIKGAKKALVNITTSETNFMFSEMTDVMSSIQEAAGNNCNIKMGVVYTEEETDDIVITVVATGFSKDGEKKEPISQKKFTKEQELPFRQPAEQPIYRPPTYNTHQYNTVVSNEIETSIISGNAQTPRGSQLKNFDPPAYERRVGKMASENEIDEEKSKVHFIGNSQMHSISDLEAEENLNQPAFLRKILD